MRNKLKALILRIANQVYRRYYDMVVAPRISKERLNLADSLPLPWIAGDCVHCALTCDMLFYMHKWGGSWHLETSAVRMWNDERLCKEHKDLWLEWRKVVLPLYDKDRQLRDIGYGALVL